MRVLTIKLTDNQLGYPYNNGLYLKLATDDLSAIEGIISPPPGKKITKADVNAVSRILRRCLMDEYGRSKTLNDLIEASDGSIASIACSDDSRKQSYITVSHARCDKDSVTECYLETCNLMGSLRFLDPKPTKDQVALQVDVISRFDAGRKQRFLNYIMSRLQRVDFLGSVGADSTQRGFEYLLMAAFVGRLAAASGVGVFRQYRVVRANDMNFKGRIDLAEHIQKNYPLCDKIAYVKTVISTDVPLNHLIRHAIDKVMRKTPDMLQGNTDACAMARQIVNCTPTWNAAAKQSILNHKDCLFQVKHPFFAEYYEDIRRLARLIVLDEDVGLYGENPDSEVSGVVFDGALLWEGYLDSIIGDLGYRHSDPETGYGALEVFEPSPNVVKPHRMYPDFYRDHSHKRILDAKYKRGLKRDDILQMLAYVLNTGAESVGLVYPPSREWDFKFDEGEEDLRNYCAAAPVEVRQGFGSSGTKVMWRSFHYDPLPDFVDEKDSDIAFVSFMRRQEDRLRKFAKGMIGEDE